MPTRATIPGWVGTIYLRPYYSCVGMGGGIVGVGPYYSKGGREGPYSSMVAAASDN